jgi:hypothetical protein
MIEGFDLTWLFAIAPTLLQGVFHIGVSCTICSCKEPLSYLWPWLNFFSYQYSLAYVCSMILCHQPLSEFSNHIMIMYHCLPMHHTQSCLNVFQECWQWKMGGCLLCLYSQIISWSCITVYLCIILNLAWMSFKSVGSERWEAVCYMIWEFRQGLMTENHWADIGQW